MSKFEYITEEEYQSDPDENKSWEYRTIASIFVTENVYVLKKLLEDISPEEVYKTLGMGCFCSSEDHGVFYPYQTINCFKYLVKKGLDINSQDYRDGNTPLHNACSYNHSVVFYILNIGANPNIRNRFGETPIDIYLSEASRDNTIDVDFLRCAIKRGYDVKSKSTRGSSIHFLLVNDLNKYLDIIDLWIRNGFDINSKNDKDETILHYKTNQGILEKLIPELYNRGFDIEAKDNKGIDIIDSFVGFRIENKHKLRKLFKNLISNDVLREAKEPDII